MFETFLSFWEVLYGRVFRMGGYRARVRVLWVVVGFFLFWSGLVWYFVFSFRGYIFLSGKAVG